MRQIDLTFDSQESAKRKKRGMESAARSKDELLFMARWIAFELGRKHGETDCDEVCQELNRQGFPDCLGPAAGSIFKTKDWQFTGRFRKSSRISNHSRLIRIWRLI